MAASGSTAEGGSGAVGAPADAPIRVLVVDDHKVFAELLGFALQSEPDLLCVGHATSASEAVALARELQPDAVVMDLHLGDGEVDGILATQTLLAEHPTLRVVVLTAQNDLQVAVRAAAAGAVGFMQKDGALQNVMHALRAVHEGAVLLPAALLSQLAGATAPLPRSSGGLSTRELDVLRLMGEGMDPRAIGEHLHLSVHTARTHVKNIMGKLEAHSQLEAVLNATRLGLLERRERR